MSSESDRFTALVEAIRAHPLNFDTLLEELDWHQNYSSRDEPADPDEPAFIPFMSDLKLIESQGGEGKGGSYWKIFSYRGRILRLKGAWTSWHGPTFDSGCLDEVEPRQVVTTVYEPVKNLF